MEMNRDVLCKVELAEGEKEIENERKKGENVRRDKLNETEKKFEKHYAKIVHIACKKGNELESNKNAFSQSTLSMPFNFITISLFLSSTICLKLFASVSVCRHVSFRCTIAL